ncbi:hypothetical protein KSP39_PZI000201 [Platanthera zijinensis]|uniref:Protein Lines C-terminal domain-containing protein n=1 Tax=Platanthera zijinensis TaxID=2320716 RepID=A0AAP0BZI9_9ASPA
MHTNTFLFFKVAFLNADCQFVRHASGNVILSISNFLIKFECLWCKSLQLVWFSLQYFMSTFFSRQELSTPSVISINEGLMLHEPNITDSAQDHTSQFSRFIALLKSRLLNANLFVVVHLFQTSRSILKSLRHESDDLEEVFMQYGVSSLIKMPWDSLIDIFSNCCYASLISFVPIDEVDSRSSLTGIKNLLLGTIFQLCCSLVRIYDFEAHGTGRSNELSTYLKFCDLVPKFLSCCFIHPLGDTKNFLSGYLKHKSLIMMTRLSLHSSWENSHPESWLKYLSQFFGEILHQSISECATGFENCLGESPFLASKCEVDKSYTRHLQRQTIFLLFKCSFTIARVGEASKECACEDETTSSSCGSQICRNHCNLGSLDAFSWLQRWCPQANFQGCINYFESCNSFVTSFLQLYIEEDDLLFKILLQLLDTPFSAWQKESSNKSESVGANKDIVCHFSSIFCPIRLFHLVLLLLSYDHLVLVDYLISKDTGIHCLQYLLRCLHVIHNSWPAFLQFSIFGNKSDHHHKRRRKVPLNEDEGPTLLSSTNAAFRRQLMGKHKKCQTAYEISDLRTFENAERCLSLLKISLGELQRKSLFPYNLKPLLKRFAFLLFNNVYCNFLLRKCFISVYFAET